MNKKKRVNNPTAIRIAGNRMTALLLIAVIGIMMGMVPVVSQAGPDWICSFDGECKCDGSIAWICSEGVWHPAHPAYDAECYYSCKTGATTTIQTTTSTSVATGSTTTSTTATTTSTTTTSGSTTTTMPPSNGKTHGTSGDPVNTGTGEYYFEIPAFNLGGPLPLAFSLYYGSLSYTNSEVRNAFDPSMGYNWLHSFNIALVNVSASEVHILYYKGKIIRFVKTSEWTLKDTEDTPYQLKNSGSLWYFMDPSTDLVYKFDSDGKLLRITSRNSNSLTLTYSGNVLASVSDGLGRTLNFTYNSAMHLSKVCDGNSRCVQMEYSSNLMTGFTDVPGNKTVYEYQGNGLITRTVMPKGNSPNTQTYNTEGRVVTQKDAYSNTVTISWLTGGAASVENPDGTTVQHTHLSQQLLTEFTDEAGKKATLGYDANNRRTRVQDRLNSPPIEMTFHPESGKLLTLKDELGFEISYTYTAQSQSFEAIPFTFCKLTRIDYSDSSWESFTYNAAGNMLTKTDQLGNQTVFTYNSRGQVLTETNAAGGVTENGYNEDGTVAWGQTTDTGKTVYAYDVFKRLIKETFADGAFTETSYDLKDRIVSETDELGRMTKYDYDANGNKIKITYPDGSAAAFEYNLMDRIVKCTDSQGGVTQIAYNARGFVVSVTDRNNITHQYGYDSRGRKISETDGAGKIWQTAYNDEDIPISRTTPLGFTTSYTANAAGQIVSTVNALGEIRNTSTDNQGRITEVKDGLNRQTRFTYNPAGIVTQIESNGISSGFERDAPGQIKKITDADGNVWSFAYTAMGRLKETSDPLGRKRTRTYDSLGRLQTLTYPDGEVQTFTYNSAGNPIKRSFSGGAIQNFSFDSMNRMTAAEDISFTLNAKGKFTKTTDGDVSFGASYSGGHLNSVSYANGLFQVNYAYDARGLLSEVSDTLTHAKITMTYDDDYRLKACTRSNGLNTDFSWDKAGRLIRIQDGSLSDQQYSLNAAGEVVQATCDVPLTPSPESLVPLSRSYAYNAASEVSSDGYEYDKRGRMIRSPSSLFQWDSAGRVITAGPAALTYNGLDNLRTRTENGVTIHYYYNYGLEFKPVAAEKNDTTGAWKRFYVWSPRGELLYSIDAEKGNAVFFHHFDRLGSTLFLTDGTGNITDKYAYSPYGLLLAREGNSDQPFTFVGRLGVRAEGGAGIYHMRSRYYDSMTGRFLSRDAYWPDTSRIHGANPYLYADANPVLYTDSTGNDLEFLQGVVNVFTENYFSSGTKKTNNKFVNFVDDLGKYKIAADTVANQGWIVRWSKTAGISGGITCNVLSRLYPTVPMSQIASKGLLASRCQIPAAPFKIMEGGKVAGKAFVIAGGAVSMYEIYEWQAASPEKAGLAMSASLSYKALELAEKVPGVDYAVQGVGGVVQKGVESGVIRAAVGDKAVGAQMVETLIQNDTLRDYVVSPIGWIGARLAGDK